MSRGALLSVYSCSSDPDYNGALLRCMRMNLMAVKSPLNHTGSAKDCMQMASVLLNQAKGNDTLHNGCVVLLAPQRKRRLLDQTPKKE